MNNKFVSLLLASVAALPAFAGEVRINGASTTVVAVINPHKAAVEAATGLTLKVAGTNTGKGLAALVENNCDVSLTSEPLDVSMAAAKFNGKDLNPADFRMHPVTETSVAWVVNPANSVSHLTAEQVSGILSGKILNWKEVGGADQPIVVLTDLIGAGTRTLIQFRMLDRGEFGANTRQLENVRLIASNVSELKGAFSGIGVGFVDPKLVKVVTTDKVLTRPLGFITKGAPTADVQKVIDAFKAEVAKAAK